MRTQIRYWSAMLLISMILFGCGQADNSYPAPAEASKQQPANDSQTKGEAVSFEVMNTSAENAPADQGNVEATLGGEVIVNEKTLSIKGKTNLLPGAKVVGDLTVKDYNVWGYQQRTEVRPDGTFELELQKPEMKKEIRVELSFRPSEESDRIKSNYGENGEKLSGPLVYQYLDSQTVKHELAAYAHIAPDAPLQSKIPFETPQWEKPSDYGQPTIWIKPTVTKDEKHLYVTAKSNLLEGTRVKADIEIPGHWHYGYNDLQVVKPDGSFSLEIPQPESDVDMFYFLIRFEPDEQMWPTAVEAYGAKGEKLKGNLVKVKDIDNKTVNIIEMKIKITK